jgi:hypothetical protein
LLRRLADGQRRIGVAAATAAAAVPISGGWTAQEVVLHLVAVEVQVFQRRLLDLASPVAAQWTWTEPGPATMRRGETMAETSARFAIARAETLARVTALDDAGWRRSGNHATLGRLDVAGLLAVATAHDLDHLGSLVTLGRSSRTGSPGARR